MPLFKSFLISYDRRWCCILTCLRFSTILSREAIYYNIVQVSHVLDVAAKVGIGAFYLVALVLCDRLPILNDFFDFSFPS